MGAAPVIQDGDITLAESAACIEYILTKYGKGKLTIAPTAPNYADYLYWFYWSSGNFQPIVSSNMLIAWSGLEASNPVSQFVQKRLKTALGMLEERLGKSTWLAGEEFTIADIMPVFSLTTGRLFFPYSLQDYPNIRKWLERISQREGYKRSMEKGDPGMEPMIGVDPPEPLRSSTLQK
jgi:glutathione S-transferase